MFDGNLEQTVGYVHRETTAQGEMYVTIFDGERQPEFVNLSSFRKKVITFGRKDERQSDQSLDIVLSSHLVSRRYGHGQFVNTREGWFIEDGVVRNGQREASTNGILFNDAYIQRQALAEGGIFRIDSREQDRTDNVLILVSTQRPEKSWSMLPVRGGRITIGRDSSSTLQLDHITVSRHHATIFCENGTWYIQDEGSANGLLINGTHCLCKTELHEKDVISITNTTIVFTSAALYFHTSVNGVAVEARDIVVRFRKHGKTTMGSDHVSLSINPGELVAIVGGSGTGKSTIMSVLCGYLAPNEGSVYINGCNLYKNFDALKNLFGYVPQSDIVYDNLTVYDMLRYTAELRLPKDTSAADREAAIRRVLGTVALEEHKDKLISKLSGGQRKRASIAVELLPDPKLLFLDEPVSGLDPATERDLMLSLRRMTKLGKTVVLVTHSTLQLSICDKIAFMGRNGKLCYVGDEESALSYFQVNDVVDIYNKITDAPDEWKQKYDEMLPKVSQKDTSQAAPARQKRQHFHQQWVLCKRYARLVLNDRLRLGMLLLQAPLLALLISWVADGSQFEQYDMTKSLLFSLSCSAFWIGMLNAIQEICKERTILKREYMSGLSLPSYISAKMIVLGALGLVQSLLLISTFALTMGLPEKGVFIAPFAELFLTAWFTTLSATATGLFVSSLFRNPDRAMTAAPLLLMPQMLFSGLLFKLSGFTEIISWFAICRWSMEGFGTTADLNSLSTALQQQGLPVPHEAESFFEYTAGHLQTDWGIMILFVFLFLALALLVLPSIKKQAK